MLLLTIALLAAVELILFSSYAWPVRRWLAFALAAAVPATTTWFALEHPGGWLILLAAATGLRIFGYARVVHDRRPHGFLLRNGALTAAYALAAYYVAVMLSLVAPHPGHGPALLALALVQAGAAVAVLLSTLRSLAHADPPEVRNFLPDKELPTVTVAVPARNETQDMADCIESLLRSDYPKLEIVVLDDCSQDKTPDVIKSFAHDGVRFIKGDEPNSRWVAKNFAYHRLMQESNGQIILFCGVDVRLGSRTIRSLVNAMHDRQKRMVSVLPVRTATPHGAAIIQPMRYWWELALPRRLLNRPPVLSTCWMVERSALEDMGGFEAMSRTILPEAVVARYLTRTDAYAFWKSHGDVSVVSTKSLPEQRATAVRMRYPQTRQRAELSMAIAAAELLLMLGAPVVAVAALLLGLPIVAALSACAAVCFVVTHYLIMKQTNPGHGALSILTFPLAVLTEVALGLESVYKYEFSYVDWKGRNVCIPIMRVIPHLPPLPKDA